MNVEMVRLFRKKIENGIVSGPFSKTCDPAFIEVMGYSGCDFVIIDLEHGPNHIENIQNLIRAAEISGVFPIVRIKENMLNMAGEALDIGALGIQVPQIENRKQAEAVIQHAKFAPLGQRGVCRYVRAAKYSHMDKFDYFNCANETVIVIQLEGKEALNNLEEILNVKDIDIVFIGPYDLSQSLGVPGQVNNPVVEAEIKKIVALCKMKHKLVGIFIDSTEDAPKWKKAGVRYISYSVDLGILREALTAKMKHIKNDL